MRMWGMAALALLAGCDQPPTRGVAAPAETASPIPARTSASVATFDDSYAYRLPNARIKGVQDSHANGCDRLGSARCRITAMRYAAAKDGNVTAILTLKLDPAIARAFGQAATRTVTQAHGLLLDSDVAGADDVAATGRGDTVIARLRDALGNADAAARSDTSAEQVALANAKAARLRAALATIVEIHPSAATSVATTPVMFSYISGKPVGDAAFDTAGRTLRDSLGELAILLAGIGPWILLLLGGALLLRRFVPVDTGPEVARVDGPEPRGPLRRWFRRDAATPPDNG